MKKVLVVLTVVTLLAFGAIAYAGPGFWGGGHMAVAGYGDHMGHGYGMGKGWYGGHMERWTGGYDQKFLDETTDLRKELHNKNFEYMEAARNPETNTETIAKLQEEINDLREKVHEQAPQTANTRHGGFGRYGGYGCNR
jgi:hypothetical protein